MILRTRHRHKSQLKTFVSAIAVNGLLAGVAGPAFAQDDAGIDTIVVTSQKRAESSQEVPISLNAYSGDTLEELGVSSAEDVLKLIPSGQATPLGGAKKGYFIRGVGNADFQLNAVGAIGVYIDDVAINFSGATSFSTFDVERVEVMRGPQNTLFGRNTTGGAVNYVSRKPDLDGFNAYVSGGYGRFDQRDIEGAINIPLGETVALRLSGLSNQRDGVFDNLTTGVDNEGGSIDRQALRAQLLFAPTDTFEVLLSGRYGVSDGTPNPYKIVGTRDPNDVTQPCAIPLNDLQFNPPSLCADGQGNTFQNVTDFNQSTNTFPHFEDIDAYGSTLNIGWDLGFATLTSVTAYDRFEYRYIEDTDGAPQTIFNLSQFAEYDQYSQEIRLVSPDDQRFRWLAGYYFFFEDAEYIATTRRVPAPAAPTGDGTRFNTVPNTQVDQDNRVHSLYGQAEYDITDRLTATVGLRWTNETKEGINVPSVRCTGSVGGPPFCNVNVAEDAQLDRDLVNSLPTLFAPPAEDLEFEDNNWGGRFALDFQATDNLLLFASYSRGFKAGGFNIAPLTALNGNAANTVNAEILTAYEVGFKSDLLDGNMQLNGAVYYYDWEDLQTFSPTFDPDLNSVLPQLVNFPEAHLVGGELELLWAFADGWLLSSGININESAFDDVGVILGAQVGNRLPSNPNFSHTGVLRKEMQVGNGTLSLQTNWRYKGETDYSFGNEPYLAEPSFWNVGARVAYDFGSEEQYQLGVWADNITGAEVCLNRGSLLGLADSILCQPANSRPTFGVTFRADFGG